MTDERTDISSTDPRFSGPHTTSKELVSGLCDSLKHTFYSESCFDVEVAEDYAQMDEVDVSIGGEAVGSFCPEGRVEFAFEVDATEEFPQTQDAWHKLHEAINRLPSDKPHVDVSELFVTDLIRDFKAAFVEYQGKTATAISELEKNLMAAVENADANGQAEANVAGRQMEEERAASEAADREMANEERATSEADTNVRNFVTPPLQTDALQNTTKETESS